MFVGVCLSVFVTVVVALVGGCVLVVGGCVVDLAIAVKVRHCPLRCGACG